MPKPTLYNLRHDRDTDSLMPVAAPSVICRSESLPLLVIDHPTARRMAFFSRDGRLVVVYLDSMRPDSDLCPLGSPARTALRLSDSRVVVMLDHSCIHIDINAYGTCTASPTDASYPAVRFSAISETTLSTILAERSLSGNYSTARTGRLCDADEMTLADDLRRSYCRLSQVAADSGMSIQPVIVRYRLEGSAGEVIYRSPEVLVGPDSGFQCVSEMSTAISTYRAATNVAARAFRIHMSACSAAVAPSVARLVVEMSMPIHPISAYLNPHTSLRIADSTLSVRFFMPGTSVMMTPSTSHGLAHLDAITGGGEDVFATVAVIDHPFDGDTSRLDIDLPVAFATTDAIDQVKALNSLARSHVKSTEPSLNLLRAPHTFTASSATVTGNHVVWANLTVTPFAGPDASALAVKVADMAWQAEVAYTASDGTVRRRLSSGATGAPVAISPLLYYPAADVVSATIKVSRGGRVYCHTTPMKPSRSGCASIAVTASCAPIMLAETPDEFTSDDSPSHSITYHTSFAVATLANPLEVIDVSHACPGAVTAVAAVDRRGSAWDYSRPRAYIITRAGTFLTTLAASGRIATFQRLDSRAVTSANAVTATTDARYPLVMIASGDLLALSRGQVAQITPAVNASALAWDAANSELWLLPHSADAPVRVTQGVKGDSYLLTSIAPSQILTAPTSLLALADGRLYDTSHPSSEPVNITYEHTVDAPVDTSGLPRTMSMLYVDVDSSDADISVGVRGTNPIDRYPQLMGSNTYSGPINAPIHMCVFPFRADRFCIRISGYVVTDTHLRTVRPTFRRSTRK